MTYIIKGLVNKRIWTPTQSSWFQIQSYFALSFIIITKYLFKHSQIFISLRDKQCPSSSHIGAPTVNGTNIHSVVQTRNPGVTFDSLPSFSSTRPINLHISSTRPPKSLSNAPTSLHCHDHIPGQATFICNCHSLSCLPPPSPVHSLCISRNNLPKNTGFSSGLRHLLAQRECLDISFSLSNTWPLYL